MAGEFKFILLTSVLFFRYTAHGVQDCPLLDVPLNGNISYPINNTDLEGFNLAVYSCEPGYELSGTVYRVCQSGQWSAEAPECLVSCGSLDKPENGVVVINAGGNTTIDTGEDAVATYTCNSGYHRTAGSDVRTCQTNGVWSGKMATCVLTDCGPLESPENGTVSITEPGTLATNGEGAVAKYTCNSGYHLTARRYVRSCRPSGVWSGEMATCVLTDCGPLKSPKKGTVMIIKSGILTTNGEGAVATYICNSGYYWNGSNVRTCRLNGIWSGEMATCVLTDCGPLESPENGTVTITESGTLTTNGEGAVATYTCNSGYYRNGGSDVRTCQPSGVWSGEMATCVSSNTTQPNSDKSAYGSITTIGAVLGVAVVVLAVLIILVATLAIILRRQKSGELQIKGEDSTHDIDLTNPVYTGGARSVFEMSASHRYESISEHQAVISDEHIIANSRIQFENSNQYSEIQEGNFSVAQSCNSSSYEIPVVSLQSHYEFNIHVPTIDQRTEACTQSGFGADGQYEGLGKLYTALEQAQREEYASGQPITYFEEADSYWNPSSDENRLYEQLATRKYREIPRNQVQIVTHLGTGQFGTVNKGIWQSTGRIMDVAIKMLKTETGGNEKVKFLQEAAINGQFRHPNVVKLLGVVTVGEPVMIILEFLSHGDLSSYLIKQQPIPGELVATDTATTLLGFCQHVASGMEYLSRKAFVHRDLAARNVLLSDKRICKISDFGMSRDVVTESYYISCGGKVPVKWTAPEALHFRKYSTASDVWSFGAVMYEIWSLGRKPFTGCTNQQAMRMVDSGYRLPPPPGCPKELYILMIRCWHPGKSQRPAFAHVVEALSEPEFDLLSWSEEDAKVHPQATVLGASLEAGKDLYPELQEIYKQPQS